ncbi:hypothetical protein [Niastella sp. OAS944]|uniref:hypothetical protein n=1 Tax=Niastella sp. OAS944 TaxID=2664089 RepID=UPI00348F49B2|nr:hypothetical protein [Chitinophagaceae bacterium OAS944]
MAILPKNFIAIDAEITIAGGANGVPFSLFDPNHPFAHQNQYRPLPYYQYENKFNDYSQFNRERHLIIEEELTITPPPLDLKKAFNCFNQVQSAGAKYSIKLCLDVPNNKNPLALPPETGSQTGHTFIVITKSNAGKTITQVFGFYAKQHPGYLFPWRAMPSIILNNQLREINASLEMSLTQDQFDKLRQKAFDLAKNKYAADSYNCTNFGMDLFNSVRIKPIVVEKFTVFLPVNHIGPNLLELTKTPQMLFKKLKSMKDGKDAESPNIIIDTTGKTKAPLSHGECN